MVEERSVFVVLLPGWTRKPVYEAYEGFLRPGCGCCGVCVLHCKGSHVAKAHPPSRSSLLSSRFILPVTTSAFSKSSLSIWKFMVQVDLKPDLENLEHYFASVRDDYNCSVV